jgi:uncharacterized protein YfiM (DUF2279 family)
MNKILVTLVITLLSFSVMGQDKWLGNDKLLHLNTSMTMTFTGGQIIYGVTGWKYSNELAAVGVLSMGIAKEYLLDEQPSGKDIAANMVGIIAGYYVNKVIDKKIKQNRLWNKK